MTLKSDIMITKLYMLEEQVGFMMRLAGQRHSGVFQVHAPLGLTPAQFSLLIKVLELRECSQNYLGRKTAKDAGHQITKETLEPLSVSENEMFLTLLAKIS